MELPRDLRVGWDKMISREMQLEMWKIENQGVRKSLDELAQRYSAPGDEWRRHLPAMPLSLDRSSQTDATELRPVSDMDDERRLLRKELDNLRKESEDALRRQKLFYEAQLNKVGPELRAQSQKQVRALELEMEERLRAVRAACRVQLRNELARATAQLRSVSGPADLTEAEVQVGSLGDEVEQSASQLTCEPSLQAESREWWTQEREELLHEAACRLQRQTNTLRRMAARIDQLEEQLAVARIKEEGTKLETRRRGGAMLTSAEAELRLEAVRRHAQRLETALEARRREAEQATSEATELRRELALLQGCVALRGHWLGTAEALSNREEQQLGAGESVSSRAGRSALDERGTQQMRGRDREKAPQRLTSWIRLAATKEPPPQIQDRPQSALRRDQPHLAPPMSAGTRSTDSLERVSLPSDDRSVLRDSLQEVDELQRAWADAAASPSQGAAEEGFYLQSDGNQDLWSRLKKRDVALESNASGRATHSACVTADRAQFSPRTDDDDDVITEKPARETVASSAGTFSESKSQSWLSSHRNIEATGRFRPIDALKSPRSQVVHNVVEIEPDFTSDFRRRGFRRSRFARDVEGEVAVYPLQYSARSQKISSVTYTTASADQAWPSSYTERNVESAGTTPKNDAIWSTTEVKGELFDKATDYITLDSARTPRSPGTRARMAKTQLADSKMTWSKPRASSMPLSDTSSAESTEREHSFADYYGRMMLRMSGDVGPTRGRSAQGQPGWARREGAGIQEHGVSKTAWRRFRSKARGNLSQQSAGELDEIERRRRLRQIQNAEGLATKE